MYIKSYQLFEDISIPVEYEFFPKDGGYLEARLYPIYLDNVKIGEIGVSNDIENKALWIWGFEIYLKFRRLGYSKSIINLIITKSKNGYFFNKKFNTILLHCYPDNIIANNLYKSIGFELIDGSLIGRGIDHPQYSNIYKLNLNTVRS